jgi:aspartate/methionine/tyrosine aminotransferase
MQPSARLRAVQAPIIPIIGELVRTTPGAISLGQGVVSYGPPQASLDALAHFGHAPSDHRYGPDEGLPELRRALAEKLLAENNLEVQHGSRVVVTAGANMGFLQAVLAIADPGDELILSVPFYFNHDMAIVMSGCVTVPVPMDDAYQLDLDAIERAITPRTRAIVTVSPNNPSGAVYPESALRAVGELCRERGLYHIHDETYEYFLYDHAIHWSPGSAAGAADHTISLFSLSKAYGFASWRVGYAVVPEHLFEAYIKIQDTNVICAALVSQRAALAALGVGRTHARSHVERLGAVRQMVRDRLAPLSRCVVPEAKGAFYYLLRLDTPLDAVTLATRLISEHGVAGIPGTAFGLDGGCYLRISYGALDAETVAEGIDRLVRGIQALTS